MKPAETRLVASLLDAYRAGIFPMADPDSGAIHWFSPDPRAVFPLEAPPGRPGGLRVTRSLAQRLRQARFQIVSDCAFDRVIAACAAPRPLMREDRVSLALLGEPPDALDRPAPTWIDPRIIHAYSLLHRHGHAHSVEAYLPQPDGPPRLVGGLYGVHIGAAFFGESMFSKPGEGGTDASKVCLVLLVNALSRAGYVLFDTQMVTSHVARFGGREIPRRDYLLRLKRAIAEDDRWGGVSIA